MSNHKSPLALACIVLTVLMSVSRIFAADTPYVPPAPVLLWPEGAPGATGDSEEDKPALSLYLPDKDKNTGCAVIVCPGGAFTHRAADYEGVLIAEWLRAHGIAALVLRYRLMPIYKRNDAVADGHRAVQFLRAHADEYKISPNRVGMIGFSAGSELACMAVFGVWMMISPDWRRVSPVGRVTWAVALPVGIWLLATPYAHPNDDLLLLPLFMLTVGRDARRVHGLGLGLSLATLVLILLIWPSGVILWQLGLALLGLLSAALWHWRTEVRLTGFGAGLCVLVLATLPAVWGFHLLAVGLTPIAVLILVVEGGRTCWIEVGGAGTGPAYFEEPTVPGIAPLASGA